MLYCINHIFKAVKVSRKFAIKLILLLVFTANLTACNDLLEDLLDEAGDAIPEINLDHYIGLNDTNINFFSDDGNDLYIRSNRSTIIILSGSVLGNVLVEGRNCMITFEDPISIKKLDIEGSDNVINVPTSSGITINSDSGSGNSLILF